MHSLFFATKNDDDLVLDLDDHFFNTVHFVIDQRLGERFALAAATGELPDDAECCDSDKDDLHVGAVVLTTNNVHQQHVQRDDEGRENHDGKPGFEKLVERYGVAGFFRHPCGHDVR